MKTVMSVFHMGPMRSFNDPKPRNKTLLKDLFNHEQTWRRPSIPVTISGYDDDNTKHRLSTSYEPGTLSTIGLGG